jgi:hypothetical protein
MLVMTTGYLAFAFLAGVFDLQIIPLDVFAFILNGIGQSTVSSSK